MSEITDALSALATRIDGNISGVTPKGVWVHPTDAASISTSSTPFVIVAQQIGVDNLLTSSSYGETAHQWTALVTVFLENFGEAPVPFESVAFATPLAKYDEWIKAMRVCLQGDLTLDGNASHTGGDLGELSYRVDYLHWESEVYFGIVFELPVYQTFTHTVSA